MPLYTLASHKPLTYAVREAVATAITDIHCLVTGAPAQFVNVIFMFGHSVSDGKRISVIGNVRSGGNRTEDVLLRLSDQLQTGIADKSNTALGKVSVRLVGVPSSWVMEGGQMMPEPGAEVEWLKAQT